MIDSQVEDFRRLAALIAAHPGQRVVGRTRLQKEVKLLQRMSFPTSYDYMLHFYGPYSEGLVADLGLLEAFGWISEQREKSKDGLPYYVIQAGPEVDESPVAPFKPLVLKLADWDAIELELAATYDAFREAGADHAEAMKRLLRKKGEKCRPEKVAGAMRLLRELQLPSD